METLSETLLVVFVLAILGCDSGNNLECVSQDSEIFSLSTDGKRSNAKENCAGIQIRMLERAGHCLANETKLNEDYGC